MILKGVRARLNKRTIIDKSYAVAYCHAHKPGATIEGITTDRSYTVVNCYTCKSVALHERIRTDRSYAVAYCHARKFGAITECTFV